MFGVVVAFFVRRRGREVVVDSQECFRRSFASSAAMRADFGVDFAPKFVEIAAKPRQNRIVSTSELHV